MKVILLQAVQGLGEAGELVNAKTGYARNYLIPNGLALEGTPKNIKDWEKRVEEKKEEDAQVKAEAMALKEQLEQANVELTVKTGEGGRLFGSITAQDIADALKAQGIQVDRKRIELKSPIKETGSLTVPVRVYPEVTANLSVNVQGA